MKTQICKNCGVDKVISEFGKYYNNARNKTYYRKSCKPCRVKEVSKIYRSDPKVRYSSKQNAIKSRLKKTYGITVEDFDLMLKKTER